MGRNTLCLNGEWEFMPIYEVRGCRELPQEIIYEKEKITVPSSWRSKADFGNLEDFNPFDSFMYPEKWGEADTGLYHKSFIIPEDMRNHRIFLKFNGIMQTAAVYVNNQLIASWEEAYLPLKVDITDFVSNIGNSNELMVVCSTFEEVVIASGQTKSLGIGGSWFSKICRGIWEDVYLESYPQVYIEDVFVKTSVRNEKIEAQIRIKNESMETKEYLVKVNILDDDITVKSFHNRNVEVLSKDNITINFEEIWENARLWMPDNPHLYHIKAVIYDGVDEIDMKLLRFGFREVWTEEDKFILNGIRINLRGDSWHFQGAMQQSKQYALNWYKMCQENGVNCIRLHAEPYPEYYLEAADEVGMIIIDETAIYGSSKAMPANHPVYIDNCKKHIERLLNRDRNHPSIVIWSLQNEMRWVDGRDGYKLHIKDFMNIYKQFDGTRPIILDGDNRLITKDATEIESLHYNIDGTVEQWDRKRPLSIGEHGGWWYICPQNSSAYNGLKTYLSYDESNIGVTIKEKLYVEYSRRQEVTAISSFNFVHYMMKSQPEEDVTLNWEDLNTKGCKPKIIRKHSLTLNNGLLKDAPLYKPSVALEILRESYKPVTIIPSEYNNTFFDQLDIARSFDVYNDTFHCQNTKIDFEIKDELGAIIYEKEFIFYQKPGERKNVEITFKVSKINNVSELKLTAALYHDMELMHLLIKEYKIYPTSLKTSTIDCQGKKVAYYGENDACDRIINNILPTNIKIKNLRELLKDNYDLLIIGAYIDLKADEYQSILSDFIKLGGAVVVLEQFKFVTGSLKLFKQPFFSAHINDKAHDILKGFKDEDFIFWKPKVTDMTPESIIEECFEKPENGDVNMLLECSAGDFGDGGDLWSPLIEYGHEKGTIIFSQLQLINSFEEIPQACLLLRQIIEYAINFKPKVQCKTAFLQGKNRSSYDFILKTGLDFKVISSEDSFDNFEILILDMKDFSTVLLNRIQNFAYKGGKVFILPTEKDNENNLKQLLQTEVIISAKPTYQLNNVNDDKAAQGISLTDMFGLDKIYLTPRQVDNNLLAAYSIEVSGGKNILMSVTGTPWVDYFVYDRCAEFSRIAIADICSKNKEKELPYMVSKEYGNGVFILCQIQAKKEEEKKLRIYSRILSNLGAFISTDIFTYHKGKCDYSVNYFMTLPHEEYNDYEKAEKYYTDREYSLNNLGEGLYGWMKKVERDKAGFINVENSAYKKYFLSCFVDYIEDKCSSSEAIKKDSVSCDIDMDINCSFKIWINGELKADKEIENCEQSNFLINNLSLEKGLNRFVITTSVGSENLRFRPVFKLENGSYMDNIKFQLTIDEVDPK